MSIKIRLEASGLVMQAHLKDEALDDAIQLIQKNRVEEQTKLPDESSVTGSLGQAGDREANLRTWLAAHSPGEAMNLLKWDTYPDKILLLGAFHEAKGGSEGWKSADMERMFAEAKESPPANFPRDIRGAIKSGWIRTVTARTYAVSRTGWNRLADALEKTGAI